MEAVARLGLSDRETPRKVALFEKAHSGLMDLGGFGTSAGPSGIVAHWVPGRVEFLGKHTDYAGGRSLLCTVERGVSIVAQPRRDSCVRIHATSFNETIEITLDANAAVPK